MRKFILGASLCGAFALSSITAAPQTWMGKISDSKCGASHTAMEHSGSKTMTDKECTAACIKGGAKYVFVSDGKVYDISNQTMSALSKYAGDDVTLTGEMKGDSITVSKIEAPKKK